MHRNLFNVTYRFIIKINNAAFQTLISPTVGGCLRTDGADLGKYQTITDIFDMGRFQSSRNRLKVKIVVIKMRLTFRDTKESSILGTL